MSTWLIVAALVAGFLALSAALALLVGRAIRLRDTRSPSPEPTEPEEDGPR